MSKIMQKKLQKTFWEIPKTLRIVTHKALSASLLLPERMDIPYWQSISQTSPWNIQENPLLTLKTLISDDIYDVFF
jgi:hypothetical protein